MIETDIHSGLGTFKEEDIRDALKEIQNSLELSNSPEDLKEISEKSGRLSSYFTRMVWGTEKRNEKIKTYAWYTGMALGALAGYLYVSDMSIVCDFSDWVADMLIKYDCFEPAQIPREHIPDVVGTMGTALLGAPLTEKISSGIYRFFSGMARYKVAAQLFDEVSLEAGEKSGTQQLP